LNRRIFRIENFPCDEKSLLLHETLFHNANGYIGVRSSFEEGYPDSFDSIRGMYINGFYDIAPMNQAEALYGLPENKQVMLNVADTQTIRLFLDGETFSMFEGEVLHSERILNMEEGFTERTVRWRSPNGKEIEVAIRRMTPFSHPYLFLQEYHVKALNFDGKLLFQSIQDANIRNYCDESDPRLGRSKERHMIPESLETVEDEIYMVSGTSKSNLHVCIAVRHEMSGGRKMMLHENAAVCEISRTIQKGQTVVLRKYTVFADSIRCENPRRQAEINLHTAVSTPVDDLYSAQFQYLKKFWDESALEMEGDEELDNALCYGQYQLLQSVGKDPFCSISAKGLSGEGYEGHYFWDTEVYISPFFTLTNPAIARNLLSYRYKTLPQAKENASLLGHKKGALYPWRTIMGVECSGYYPSGTAQYHINGDIAHAAAFYYSATGDLGFLEQEGAELLIETARIWADLANLYEGKFHLNSVTGPDEYTCMINDNYYTNVCAKNNLQWAVKAFRLLQGQGLEAAAARRTGVTEEELTEFQNVADNMYLPYDKKLRINPQDDSFLQKKKWDFTGTPKEKYPLLLHFHPLHINRYQVCKQADTVLAHFLFEDEQDEETIRNSFLYYEKITTHDSSLSNSIFSIVASGLGLYKEAYDYFNVSAKMDLYYTQNTKDGIHTANMGGTYMAMVFGFAGLRIKEDGLYLRPALPDAWKSYSFKIFYHGCQLLVGISRDECRVALLRGEELSLNLYGKEVLLKNGKALVMPMAGAPV